MVRAISFLAAIAIINCISLFLGFKLFEHSGMSKSVFPIILSLFNNYLAIAASHSFTYAFIFLPPLPLSNSTLPKNIQPHYLLLASILLPLHFYLPQTNAWKICLFLVFILVNCSWVILNKHHISFRHQRFSDYLIYWNLQAGLFLISLTTGNFSWDFVHPVSTLTAAIRAAPNYDCLVLSCFVSFVRFVDQLLLHVMPVSWGNIKGFFRAFFGVGNRIVVWGPVMFQVFFSVSTSSYQLSAMVLLIVSLISSLALLSRASSVSGILSVVLKEWILISLIHIVFVDKAWLELITSCLNIGTCFILLPLTGGFS